MATTTYDQMIQRVLNWANRDSDVFGAAASRPTDGWTRSDAGEIPTFLQYAADKAYRKLRVPSLEYSRLFTVAEEDLDTDNENTDGLVVVNLPVPVDLIEVIHIRSINKGYTFDEKVDMRTFFNRYADKTMSDYWTRQGNVIKITGFIGVGDELEIHYYRRLPALDASYNVTAATYNANSDLFTRTNDAALVANTVGQVGTNVLWFDADDEDFVTAYDSAREVGDMGLQYAGNEIEHWLRDENERIVLFGALAELFAYVAEDDMFQKYAAMFLQEIEELNQEEAMRMASGGNIKVNYNSHLI